MTDRPPWNKGFRRWKSLRRRNLAASVTGFAHLRTLASTASRCQSASHCGLDQTPVRSPVTDRFKTGSPARPRFAREVHTPMPDRHRDPSRLPDRRRSARARRRAAGNPRVVAGAAGLDRRVRWVHVTELTDVREILRGGELLLSTAIAWPDDRESLARYVADLAGLGAAGLVVELGRRYPQAPPKPLLLAAEKHRLPVITLGRDTRFVTITEAVHARIIDAQLAELRASEEVHQTFTELAVEGAEPGEVVGRSQDGRAPGGAGEPRAPGTRLRRDRRPTRRCSTAGRAARARCVRHPHRVRRALGLADDRGGRARAGLGPAGRGLRRRPGSRADPAGDAGRARRRDPRAEPADAA